MSQGIAYRLLWFMGHMEASVCLLNTSLSLKWKFESRAHGYFWPWRLKTFQALDILGVLN